MGHCGDMNFCALLVAMHSIMGKWAGTHKRFSNHATTIKGPGAIKKEKAQEDSMSADLREALSKHQTVAWKQVLYNRNKDDADPCAKTTELRQRGRNCYMLATYNFINSTFKPPRLPTAAHGHQPQAAGRVRACQHPGTRVCVCACMCVCVCVFVVNPKLLELANILVHARTPSASVCVPVSRTLTPALCPPSVYPKIQVCFDALSKAMYMYI